MLVEDCYGTQKTDSRLIGHLDRAYILFVSMHQRASSLRFALLCGYGMLFPLGLIGYTCELCAKTQFLGLAESSFYPGMQYVIGSWYRKDELAKRSCIFHVSSAIATMCSGYLMAAVYHLGGRNGYAGWQWSVYFPWN